MARVDQITSIGEWPHLVEVERWHLKQKCAHCKEESDPCYWISSRLMGYKRIDTYCLNCLHEGLRYLAEVYNQRAKAHADRAEEVLSLETKIDEILKKGDTV